MPAEDIDRVIVRENSVGIRSGVSDGIDGGICGGIEYPAGSDKAKELIQLRLQGAGHHHNRKATMLESCALLQPGR